MKNRRYLLLGVVIAACFLFFTFRKKEDTLTEVSTSTEHLADPSFENQSTTTAPQLDLPLSSSDSTEAATATSQGGNRQTEPNKTVSSTDENKEAPSLTYMIDGGQAVVQGDIVIGEVPKDTLLKSLSGRTSEPRLQLWPTREIPYQIQPNVPDPERILEALAYFADTNIRFVPFKNHTDALVFEGQQTNCKSYLGYVGGLQPLWVPAGCGPQQIAHEIMHSLGFVHEQNRHDRDSFLEIFWDQISPEYKINFEKFSSALNRVSGQRAFDFESIMLYPDTMFSATGRPTMKAKTEGTSLRPSARLSAKDLERLNAAYP